MQALVRGPSRMRLTTSAFGQNTQPLESQPQIPDSAGVNIFETLNLVTPPQRVTSTNSYADYVPGSGYQQGALKFTPIFTAGMFYDDNVFALSNNRLTDTAYFLRPELAVRATNLPNGELAANAFIEKRWYNRYTSEDQVNGALSHRLAKRSAQYV